MFIIANAGLFAYLITRAGVPDAIGRWLDRGAASRPAWFLLGVNAALFVIGMFIETSAPRSSCWRRSWRRWRCTSASTRCTSASSWWSTWRSGMITPPFGVNLFAACTVARISLDRIITHLLPFVLVISPA